MVFTPPTLNDAANVPLYFSQLYDAIVAALEKTAADYASLPAAGDFTGQRVFLEDIDTYAVWTGSAWKVPNQGGTGTVTAMPASGTGKTVTVTFAIPYPAGTTPTVVANGTFTNRNAYASGVTNTGFDLTAVNNTGTQNVSYTWLANG